MKEAKFIFLGALFTVLGIIFISPTKTSQVAVTIIGDSPNRPLLMMRSGKFSYLVSLELTPVMNGYSQRVQVQVTKEKFDKRQHELANSIYGPMVDW